MVSVEVHLTGCRPKVNRSIITSDGIKNGSSLPVATLVGDVHIVHDRSGVVVGAAVKRCESEHVEGLGGRERSLVRRVTVRKDQPLGGKCVGSEVDLCC